MYFIRCSSKVTHLWCVCVCVVPLCERLSRPVRAKETSFPCNHYNFFNCANSRIVHGSYIYCSGGDLRESAYTAAVFADRTQVTRLPCARFAFDSPLVAVRRRSKMPAMSHTCLRAQHCVCVLTGIRDRAYITIWTQCVQLGIP